MSAPKSREGCHIGGTHALRVQERPSETDSLRAEADGLEDVAATGDAPVDVNLHLVEQVRALLPDLVEDLERGQRAGELVSREALMPGGLMLTRASAGLRGLKAGCRRRRPRQPERRLLRTGCL